MAWGLLEQHDVGMNQIETLASLHGLLVRLASLHGLLVRLASLPVIVWPADGQISHCQPLFSIFSPEFPIS
jgi:hypothetical protein